jgi:hypothetical protein
MVNLMEVQRMLRPSIILFRLSRLLNYNLNFSSKQYVSAFLGKSVQYNGYNTESMSGTGFPSNEFKELSSAAVTTLLQLHRLPA